jgi:exodeoxyribonuclease V alpha subunit
LVFQHGWRWNADGTWARLAAGGIDPVTGRPYTGPADAAQLRPGDLLVVDEAGMLDQETVRALLTVADECRVRVACSATATSWPRSAAAASWTWPSPRPDRRPTSPWTPCTGSPAPTKPAGPSRIPEYAALSLAMRAGADPAAVFDALAARGQIRLHPDALELTEALAGAAATAYAGGERVALVVDTGAQAADLNAAIRDRLVDAGRVDDRMVVATRAGERIGAGDRIATRRNDRDLGVANRDAWIVTAVDGPGGLHVTPTGAALDHVTPGQVAPSGLVRSWASLRAVAKRVLPADYVREHVELVYACTAHGVQGDTVTTAHVVVGEGTGAAAAYVGMTRGSQANTAHLVAADLTEARDQWLAVFARNRADLGPAHAAGLAAAEAARHGPMAPARPLDRVLADLRAAWTAEPTCLHLLAIWQPQRDILRRAVVLEADHAGELANLYADVQRTALAAERATRRAEASGAAIAADADRIRDSLPAHWDGEREAARAAARVVLAGPGLFGLRRAAVAHAGEQLTGWANRWWPHLPHLPAELTQLARVADWFDGPALWTAFDASARRAAEHDHPGHAQLRAVADAARQAHEQAQQALAGARRERDVRLAPLGPIAWAPDPQGRLADLERDLAATSQQLTAARMRITRLSAESALRAEPPDLLAREHDA